MIFDIIPMGAVRTTQASLWNPRSRAYYAWKQQLFYLAKSQGYVLKPAEALSLRFLLPMPKSWSAKKKEAHRGQPCLSKPDLDNLIKAFQDTLAPDDAAVWQYGRMEKIWSDTGAVEVITKNKEHLL